MNRVTHDVVQGTGPWLRLREGYNTASMMYEWVTTGKEPAKYTAMDDVTLITRDNFKQELEKIGLWN